MRLTSRAVLTALITIVLLPAAASAGRMPPGSFLTRPVMDVEAFCSLVIDSERVAARYAKHFRTSSPELIGYFQSELRLSTMKSSGFRTVYYISETGSIVSKRKYLSAEEPVFVARNGQPVLLQICGNPLTRDLPVTPSKPPVVQSTTLPETDFVPEMCQEMLETPVATVASLPMGELEPGAIFAPKEAVLPSIATFVNPSSLSAVVPALLGAVAVQNTRSSPPIPEPSGLMALALGVFGIAAIIRRRR